MLLNLMKFREKVISNHLVNITRVIPDTQHQIVSRLIHPGCNIHDLEPYHFLEIEVEVKNDLKDAKSTNEKPKKWKEFLVELESKKESSFNEYQKDYESKNEFELKNRISIFKNEIEPSLNVEVNKSRTAKCIEKSKYLSPDMAYWNAKIAQVRWQNLLPRFNIGFSMEINPIQKLHSKPSKMLPRWDILAL